MGERMAFPANVQKSKEHRVLGLRRCPRCGCGSRVWNDQVSYLGEMGTLGREDSEKSGKGEKS